MLACKKLRLCLDSTTYHYSYVNTTEGNSTGYQVAFVSTEAVDPCGNKYYLQ